VAKLGILGMGNMGSAIVSGLVKRADAAFLPADIWIYRRTQTENERLAALYGVHAAGSVQELVSACEYILLAVKPAYCAQVLDPLQEQLAGKVVISIAAGWDYAMLKAHLPQQARSIRVMPNTPLSVGEGMSLIAKGYSVTPDELRCVRSIFACAGSVAEVEERLFSAASSISGCGPAFVYLFIEALADGGVRKGVPRALAYELAAQTVLGAGKMVLETGMHPGALKDAVCSPGGTTIEGVLQLEKSGFRAAVMEAVGASCEKIVI
jgi:pyrroline-5-carboxylate reductase